MSLINSFKYAFEGIVTTAKSERNLRIHFLIMLCVVIAGSIVKLSYLEWAICIILFSLVISAELFNTSIERTLDFVNGTKYSEEVKFIKDASAGAVLVLSVAAAIIGVIIFASKIV